MLRDQILILHLSGLPTPEPIDMLILKFSDDLPVTENPFGVTSIQMKLKMQLVFLAQVNIFCTV